MPAFKVTVVVGKGLEALCLRDDLVGSDGKFVRNVQTRPGWWSWSRTGWCQRWSLSPSRWPLTRPTGSVTVPVNCTILNLRERASTTAPATTMTGGTIAVFSLTHPSLELSGRCSSTESEPRARGRHGTKTLGASRRAQQYRLSLSVIYLVGLLEQTPLDTVKTRKQSLTCGYCGTWFAKASV